MGKEELLIPKEDLQRIFALRRVLNPPSAVEAMKLSITYLEKSRNLAEFLINMNSCK
jgi:transcription termination factor Rho